MRLIDADALKDNLELMYEHRDDKDEPYNIGVRGAINMTRKAPTIEPPEEFEWCTDCKEYDQEKHCCHRWTKVIRKTVAEIEEEYKPKRGKWIIPDDDESITITGRCSACGWESQEHPH